MFRHTASRVLRGSGLRPFPPRLLGRGLAPRISTDAPGKMGSAKEAPEAPAKGVPEVPAAPAKAAKGAPAFVSPWEISARLHDFFEDAHRREVDLVRQLSSTQTTIQSVQRDIAIVVAILIGAAGVGAYVIDMWEKRLPAAVVAVLVEKNLMPTLPRNTTENPPPVVTPTSPTKT